MMTARLEIETAFRCHRARALAVLLRLCGSIDVAEDAVQDAFVEALRHWSIDGVPLSPVGWIIRVARNKAIDRQRRKQREDRLLESESHETSDESEPTNEMIANDELRMMFMCCHPAIALEAQVALTLRLVAGLTAAQIARGFLLQETTVAQRLVRAKAKIRNASIPLKMPDATDLSDRLVAVRMVIYLVFNEGYATSDGNQVVNSSLCEEAIGLARLLNYLRPGDGESMGLLALLLLTHARAAARVDAEGALVLLKDQDRTRWDRALIREGHQLVRCCLEANRPGTYQFQAAINAVHCDAQQVDRVDWTQILQLYDQWYAFEPSPIVALNRAVAVAEVRGAGEALNGVDSLSLFDYAPFHAVRAELLKRLRRNDEAARAYEAAIALTRNGAELRSLVRRQGLLSA